MRLSPLRLASAACVLLAGCSDDPVRGEDDAYARNLALASRFDSLRAVAESERNTPRAFALRDIATALRLGARPESVAVQDGSAERPFRAVVLEYGFVDPTVLPRFVSNYTVSSFLAWDDDLASTVVRLTLCGVQTCRRWDESLGNFVQDPPNAQWLRAHQLPFGGKAADARVRPTAMFSTDGPTEPLPSCRLPDRASPASSGSTPPACTAGWYDVRFSAAVAPVDEAGEPTRGTGAPTVALSLRPHVVTGVRYVDYCALESPSCEGTLP